MNQQSWLCAVCGKNQAISYCCCGGAETFLCEGCVGAHVSKNPFQPHMNIPVKAHGQHTIPAYFDRLQERGRNFPKAKTELLKNLETVDRCMRDFTAKIESIIETLRKYVQRKVSELQQIKAELERDINAAIHEAEEAMFIDSPVLQCNYSKLLRSFKQESQEIKVFSYEFDTNQDLLSLDRIFRIVQLSKEVGFVPQVLPGVIGNRLRVYALHDMTSKEATLSKGFTVGAVICVVDAQTAFMIGGWPANAESYFLNLSNYQLSQVQAMSTSRAHPGIYRYGEFVYVFGGFSPDLSSSEKFSLVSKSWKRLGNMQCARMCFTPCQYEGDIYLLSTYRSITGLETFNIASEQFKTLSISLSGLNGSSVCFIVDGDLMIVSENQQQMGCWQIHSAQTTFQLHAVTVPWNPLSCCSPVQVGRELFWVSYDGNSLRRFNIDTKKLT